MDDGYIKIFKCGDLSKFTNSMLFNDGTEIAYMKYTSTFHDYEAVIQVSGDLSVEWDNDIYECAEDLPDELYNIIKKNSHWDELKGVYVNNYNEFETICYQDGEEIYYEIFDDDLTNCTKEQIKNYLLEIIKINVQR